MAYLDEWTSPNTNTRIRRDRTEQTLGFLVVRDRWALTSDADARTLLLQLVRSLFPQDEEGRDFLLARGRAVESYALFEQSLASLYAGLMGILPAYAGITFFRISNARSRLAILERLLEKRHGATYDIFWTSISGKLQALADERNRIVHWTSVAEIGLHGGGQQPTRLSTLAPPNIWDRTVNTPKIVIEDLFDFILKCDYYSRLINLFWLLTSGEMERLQTHNPEVIATWREIFQKQVVYPPPSTHPLYRKPVAG